MIRLNPTPFIRFLPFGLLLSLMSAIVPVSAQSPLCYAKAGGNDSNDGSYWASAKADVMACYDALPPAGGTIYIMGGGKAYEGIPACKVDDPHGCGIWIMGRKDPNYAHPPPGWRRAKPVQFIGVGVNSMSQQGAIPQVSLGTGSPGIWLSSSTTSVSFENIFLSYPNPSVEIGIDSNGNNTALSGWIGAHFKNLSTLDCNSCPSTNGPGWLIGGGDSFDIYIDHSVIQGNPHAFPGSDNQAAVLIKPSGSAGSAGGLDWITSSVVSGGGIKIYRGANPGSLYVRDTYSESINGGTVLPCVATVWIASSQVLANLENIQTADATANVCDVRVDAPGQGPSWVTLTGRFGGPSGIYGPMVVNGLFGSSVESPLRSGQVGFDNSHVVGFSGNAQRQFGLYSVVYQNLVPSSPSSWVVNGRGGSITAGINAPDGTANAGQLNGAKGASIRFYDNTSAPWNVGDYWVGSEWVRSPGGNYGTVALPLLATLTPGNAWSCSVLNPPYSGDGEWFYRSEICKVTASKTSVDWFIMQEGLNYTNTIQVYGPALVRIPSGAVSDNEAYEIWNNLSPYSNICPVGAICGLPGKPIVVSSYGTLSNCSSSSAPAACGSAAAGSVVIAPGSSNVVVNTTEVTADSQINLTFDSSIGTKLRVTCNATTQQPYVSARVAGKSFTISVPNRFATNPGCVSYSITN